MVLSKTSRRAVPFFNIAAVLITGILVVVCGEQEAPRSLSTSDPGPLTHATPLDPKQILEGNPLTHTTDVYKSTDGNLLVAYWSASAGRFTWDYKDINEVITILEGEAFVKTSDGITHHLKQGMTLTFSAGDFAEWHVPNYIRKVAVVQNSPRPFFSRVSDKLAEIIGSLVGGLASLSRTPAETSLLTVTSSYR